MRIIYKTTEPAPYNLQRLGAVHIETTESGEIWEISDPAYQRLIEETADTAHTFELYKHNIGLRRR